MLSYTKLWKLLDIKKINPSDLPKLCGVQRSTLLKMKRGQNIETNNIDKLCEFLNCQPSEIVNYIPNNK